MKKRGPSGAKAHPVVTRDQWLKARKKLLAQEKAFTKLRDDLSRARRALPWVKVEKPYAFDGPNGTETLAGLFGTKSQLVVYHFMFAPEATQGCKHCSFWADHFDPAFVHLAHRDVTLVAVSRAPFATIETFRQRMGWSFTWVSSGRSDFNNDFGVAFTPEELKKGPVVYNYKRTKMDMKDREGVSVFFKDAAGDVFHTYSAYARGIDLLNSTYNFLDLVPKGRDEGDTPQFWVRYHDRYED